VRAGLRKLAAESRARDRSGPARRLVLCFGGSDAGRAAAARARKELAEAGLDLEIRAVAGNLAGAEVGEHFAWADLVLSAGGVTKYELALFGAPVIIVAIAENQELVGERFAAAGGGRYLGPAAKLAPGELARAVRELAADGAARAAMSAAGRRLVDGRGAARIADEIERLVEGGP
jgi:spore coat polysaccharide biosynthesis predicted glycosyltransferase SpsG